MTDYKQITQDLIKSIADFTLEYDINYVKSKMEFRNGQWEITEDLVTPQIKNHIKRQLANNNKIDLNEAQKALISEELKNKEVDDYLGDLAIKTSNFVEQGKFYMQCSFSSEQAYKLVSETIKELQEEKKKNGKNKNAKKLSNMEKWAIAIGIVTIVGVVITIIASWEQIYNFFTKC